MSLSYFIEKIISYTCKAGDIWKVDLTQISDLFSDQKTSFLILFKKHLNV